MCSELLKEKCQEAWHAIPMEPKIRQIHVEPTFPKTDFSGICEDKRAMSALFSTAIVPIALAGCSIEVPLIGAMDDFEKRAKKQLDETGAICYNVLEKTQEVFGLKSRFRKAAEEGTSRRQDAKGGSPDDHLITEGQFDPSLDHEDLAQTDYSHASDVVDGTAKAVRGERNSSTVLAIGKFPQPVPDERTICLMVRDGNHEAEVCYNRPNMTIEANIIENLKSIKGEDLSGLKVGLGPGSRYSDLRERMVAHGMKVVELPSMYEITGVCRLFAGELGSSCDRLDVVIGGMGTEVLISSALLRSLANLSGSHPQTWVCFGSQKGLASDADGLTRAFELGQEEIDTIETYKRFKIQHGPEKVYGLEELVPEPGIVSVASITGLDDILSPVTSTNGVIHCENLLVLPSNVLKVTIDASLAYTVSRKY